MAGALILWTSYGIEVQPYDDPYIKIAEQALSGINAAANAGTYLVDALPFRCVSLLFYLFLFYDSWLIVKYVPAWFPGANFKRQAQEWSIPTAAMADKPLQYVMENLV
jgi:hypothetical protein